MMSALVSIGRFAQITGLSTKALRHYAAEGLLIPAYVDPDNGYRYYNMAQAQMDGRIRLLRHLSMPLDDIWEIPHAQDTERAHDLLRQYQARIAERIEQDQHRLFLLQRLLERKEDFMIYDFSMKEVADQPIVSIRMHTPPAIFEQTIPAAMSELLAYAERQGALRRDQPCIVINYAYSEEDAEVEVCVLAERVVADESRMTSRILAGGSVASAMHVGPYEEPGLIFPALAVWIKEQEYEINGVGRAVYWDGPWNVDRPTLYRTEVIWPVKSTHGGRADE
ncbi:MAG TPA: MerR family transcriptional regulator [Ktedonobacteraceae bacterium]